MAFMKYLELVEDMIKTLDLRTKLLRVQLFILEIFSFSAKSIYSTFFYKEQKKEVIDEDELFI
jgi:hypothetical protein|tara:strand:- start:682 stop:870 length:189 start_codon:yes stop_codon:yes gene_type:complete